MSVDVLQPTSTPDHIFHSPIVPMKDTRSSVHPGVGRRKHDDKSISHIHISKTRTDDNRNINHFDPNCIIYDAETDTTYLRGRLLGKGGFARCYELLDLNTNKVYAGKIIAKSRIAKPHQQQKIFREVELQRDLKHCNVVEFHSYFEDDHNVYIILENCSRKSLVHMLRQRKSLTEPEVRYYMKQLLEGVHYIHSKNIVHRDLKLGNMLLNEAMHLKIADFGLATRVEYEGQKKMTVCGTPNYIAPEVLQKNGHSYEADVWALGCVMYTLMVGKPPFETPTLKETYNRIVENCYSIPKTLSDSAQDLIQKCLSPEPELRPSLDQLLADNFFSAGYHPETLSTSCCSHVPKIPTHTKPNRPKSYAVSDSKHDLIDKLTGSLSYVEIQIKTAVPKLDQTPKTRKSPDVISLMHSPVREMGSDRMDRSESPPQRETSPKPRSAAMLLDVLITCLDHMPKDILYPPIIPIMDANMKWVTKWVDYSNKYGFGFQLSTDVIGVLFNDTSRITLSQDGRSVQYCDVTGHISVYTTDGVPDNLEKKTKLLLYFAKYMDENLIQGGNLEVSKDSDGGWAADVCLKKWFRTNKAIVLYLTDGSLQVNFFDDHTKIILNYFKNDYFVTYVDQDRNVNTYSIMHIIQDGCQQEIIERMQFARVMLKNIVDIDGVDV